jgi:hypothetical protein
LPFLAALLAKWKRSYVDPHCKQQVRIIKLPCAVCFVW